MLLSNKFSLCLLLCLHRARFCTSLSDFYFESYELINGATKIPFYGNASVKRTGNSYPTLYADFELTDDLKHYEYELKVYHSHLGNRQFVLMPFKFPRQRICGPLKNEFAVKTLRSLQNCSNLPFSEDPKVDLCDLMPLGHYYERNCSIDPSIFSYKMPTGRFRFVIYVYKTKEDLEEDEVLITMITQIYAM